MAVDINSVMGNVSGGLTTGTTIIVYLFYGVLFGAIIYAGWQLTSYNVKVGIKERRGNGGTITVWKKGKFVKDKINPTTRNFVIMGEKRWNFPLDMSYVELQKKGFGRVGSLVYFAEDEKGRLQPVKSFESNDIHKWTGWTPESMEFFLRNMKEVIERFKKGDFWTKYGGMVQIGAFALIFIMGIVMFRQMQTVADSLGAVAANFKEAAQAFNQQVAANGTQIIRTAVGG